MYMRMRRSRRTVGATLSDFSDGLDAALVAGALARAWHSRSTVDWCSEELAAAQQASGGGTLVSDGGGGKAWGKPSGHIPLLARQTEPSIEERMSRYACMYCMVHGLHLPCHAMRAAHRPQAFLPLRCLACSSE